MILINEKNIKNVNKLIIYNKKIIITKSIKRICEIFKHNNIEILLVDSIFLLMEYFRTYNQLIVIIPIGIQDKGMESETRFILNVFYMFNKSSTVILWDVNDLNFPNRIGNKYSVFLEKILINSVSSKENEDYVKDILERTKMLHNKEKRIVFYVNDIVNISFYISNLFVENYANISNGIYQFPGGEITIIPKKNTVDGYFIYNNKKYIVKNDYIINNLDIKLSEEKNFLYPVSEIGIGINENIPKIKNLPCFEKALGTMHIGFGHNFDMGGEYILENHTDIVFDLKNIIYINNKGFFVE